jgi:hypothetical protein
MKRFQGRQSKRAESMIWIETVEVDGGIPMRVDGNAMLFVVPVD